MTEPVPGSADAVERLHRPGKTCHRLDISRNTLARLIADGELDVVWVGAHRRITESSIQRYLAQHRHP